MLPSSTNWGTRRQWTSRLCPLLQLLVKTTHCRAERRPLPSPPPPATAEFGLEQEALSSVAGYAVCRCRWVATGLRPGDRRPPAAPVSVPGRPAAAAAARLPVAGGLEPPMTAASEVGSSPLTTLASGERKGRQRRSVGGWSAALLSDGQHAMLTGWRSAGDGASGVLCRLPVAFTSVVGQELGSESGLLSRPRPALTRPRTQPLSAPL